MPSRRTVLGLLAAGAFAPAANAHTLYNQWVVFRQRHLLIGCHRQDPQTYDLAREVVELLDHLLPEASAKAARAPHPERLASLLGTDQLFLAVMARGDAAEMAAGAGRYAAYGAIPLTYVEDLGPRLLVAHANFPVRHAWLVETALRELGFGLAPAEPVTELPRHPGAEAAISGVALEEVPTDG